MNTEYIVMVHLKGKAYVNRMIKEKDGVVNKDFVQEKNPKMPWTTSFP